ncbi:MAG: D-2-hydroxyacid dehydrogenase [Planctomycetes bacterium]|nr:D-2-hydroxyacid dehydrogenase [Planctomycetota bacterium]
MVQIVVVDGYTINPGDNPWNPLEKLGTLRVHDRTAPESLVTVAANADVLITNKCPISAAAIEQLPSLKFVAVTATGHNIVDAAAARRRDIPVSNVPEYGTQTVAQFTWALILELCHRVGRHADSVAAGHWSKCPDFCYWLTPQIELAGKRLGLVGFGRIAQQVAKIGHTFGMEVLASGRSGNSAPSGLSVEWLPTDELFAAADVVSLHCPQTPETERLVNRRLLGRMRRDALLINTSRGGLVDERDLADALRAGQIAGAAVDVVSQEPIRTDNPLLSAPNCLITPHMAWSSLAARQRLMRCTAENVAAFLDGRPINVVNGNSAR